MDKKFTETLLKDYVEQLEFLIDDYYYKKMQGYEFRTSDDEHEIKKQIEYAKQDIKEKFVECSYEIDDELENIEECYFENFDKQHAMEQFVYECQIGEEWK